MSFRNTNNDTKHRHGHLHVSSDSLAESILTFRSTPDSSADSDDEQKQQEEGLHGIDLEEQSTYSTADVQDAAFQLGGNITVTISRTSVASSIGGLPPRSPADNCKTPNKSNKSSARTPPKMNSPEQRALSKVSSMYDRTNKGYLDEEEQKMRALDTAGTGHLSNEQVYDILRTCERRRSRTAGWRRSGTSYWRWGASPSSWRWPTWGRLSLPRTWPRIPRSRPGASWPPRTPMSASPRPPRDIYAFSLGKPVLNQKEDDGYGRRRLGLELTSGMPRPAQLDVRQGRRRW
mmetsp:Transcript_3879/g.9075  ORF Transcript_3879/g.9075 Transcript_3879/m.9075 type:complete len:290 (+) Transcript_3879:215-1084(+)